MSRLLLGLVRWIIRNLLSLMFILVVLFCSKWLHVKWQEAYDIKNQQAQLQSERPKIGSELIQAAQALERQLRNKLVAEKDLNKLLNSVRDSIKAKEAEREDLKKNHPIAVNLPTSKEFKRVVVLDMELSMLNQAQTKTNELTTYVGDLADGKGRLVALKLAKYHAGMRVHGNKLEKWNIRHQHPYAVYNPFSFYSKRIKLLDSQLPELQNKENDLQVRIDSLDFTVGMTQRKLKEARNAFLVGHNSVEKAIAEIDEKIDHSSKEIKDSLFVELQNFMSTNNSSLSIALGILAGIIFVPIGIKMLFYYVLAPWASKQQAICVLPPRAQFTTAANDTNHQIVKMKSSGISLPIMLKEDEELIIHSDYIQSSSTGARKSTKWVLDWTYPLTSLATGMYALTRILPHHDEPVVASSTKDALMEITTIEVPQGIPIVLQPHSLVGIVRKCEQPALITSHWRLWHLQSWLTLQFRYLVFHGPATLIIKGCRGVRLEPVGAGRLINQASTLGFSASTMYSVTRCETFVSYWRGEQELFNDKFAGESGIVLYEEIPSKSRKSGISGRGLEGLTDSVLKVFGI